MILADNNRTVKGSNNHEAILCKNPIPLGGTHSFTAKHVTSGKECGCIGVARADIGLNWSLWSNAWAYFKDGRKFLNTTATSYG